ncbi:MAG: hypothetical protein MK085_09975, partial [Phycisphaerales bacterium]|nr:hypothetical protein [Phycisphaerales bacterium]
MATYGELHLEDAIRRAGRTTWHPIYTVASLVELVPSYSDNPGATQYELQRRNGHQEMELRTSAQLRIMAKNGGLHRDDAIRRTGHNTWHPIHTVPGLIKLIPLDEPEPIAYTDTDTGGDRTPDTDNEFQSWGLETEDATEPAADPFANLDAAEPADDPFANIESAEPADDPFANIESAEPPD